MFTPFCRWETNVAEPLSQFTHDFEKQAGFPSKEKDDPSLGKKWMKQIKDNCQFDTYVQSVFLEYNYIEVCDLCTIKKMLKFSISKQTLAF